MTDKRQVKVNLEELSTAFEVNFPYQNAYLDLETGAVVWITGETRRELETIWEELPEVADLFPTLEALLAQRADLQDWQREELRIAAHVEADYGSRYLSIDPEPYSDYNDMERFIWGLKDDRLANQLENAIRGRGAFRRFKDILARHPRVQEAWYDFQARRLEARLKRWLECMDIDPVE
jgi:hypothetical protein